MIDLILNPHLITLAFILLAVGTPASGVIALTLMSKPKREEFRRLPVFYLLVVSGPLLGIMWVIYNFIENLLGLDSILASFLNLFLFCLVGLGIGALLRFPPRILRKQSATALGAEKTAPPEGKENAPVNQKNIKSSTTQKK